MSGTRKQPQSSRSSLSIIATQATTVAILIGCFWTESSDGLLLRNQSTRQQISNGLLLPIPCTLSSSSIPYKRGAVTGPTTRTKTTTTKLLAKKQQDSSSRAKGVYVRPSGAIERGSGFFFPGLEGPRVRVLFGTILLGLTGLNHVLMELSLQEGDGGGGAIAIAGGGGGGWSLEEGVAILYSILILFQAAIEFGKEELIVEGTNSGGNSKSKSNSKSNTVASTTKDWVQQWNSEVPLGSETQDQIRWSAASYLSVTPGTQLLMLQDEAILYRLTSPEDASTVPSSKDTIATGVKATLEQLRQSKGGRLALPVTHPAVVALGLDQARTVVVQRITDQSCWVMSSSDQLLVSFTPSDLKWLGQMASYIRIATLPLHHDS